jgi:prolyl-tRNA synthetase
MRQSRLFTKTRREAPKDEVAKNAQLLIRGGFVHKELAGVYSLLPLGLRVLQKINALIEREMQTLGALPLHLSALQDPAPWQASGRWSDEDLDVWFKTKLKNESELGLAPTHEEPLTALMREFIKSYRDLPVAVYQIQTKFRNELRAKSGLIRGREFLMKDLYSFHASEASCDEFYERVLQAYKNIFAAVGLGEKTYLTFASGGAFSEYSHEFQTISPAGEDTIYVDEDKGLAVNAEVAAPETLKRLGLAKEELLPQTAIEVGNIFKLGDRFSRSLGLKYTDEAGEPRPVIMASYGLGPTRLMGTIAEVLADERGLVWPASIAPFRVHLLQLPSEEAVVGEEAEGLYQRLSAAGVEVLFDDRPNPAGEKFADSDLLGLPLRVVVSERTLAAGKLELRERASGKEEHRSEAELITKLNV